MSGDLLGEDRISARSVTVESALTREEVFPVWRWIARQRPSSRFFSLVGILLVALGIPGLVGGLVTGNGSTLNWAALAVILGATYLLIPRWSIRYRWRKNPRLAELRSMTFSDEGVAAKADMMSGTHRWEFFSKVIERNGIYLLQSAYGSPPAYLYVPRRAFRSARDEEIFLQLLAAHIDTPGRAP